MRPGDMLRFESALSLWLLSALLTNTPARAADAKNAVARFQKISERNLFELKSPVIELIKPNQPVLAKITITGITTILCDTRVLFKVEEPPRAGQPAKCEFFMLCEGQSESGIEVLAVDVKSGSVKFNNHGEIQTVNLIENPVAPAPTAAPKISLIGFSPQPDSATRILQVQPPFNPEEQEILIEAQRLKALQDGDPVARILPPTQLGQQ